MAKESRSLENALAMSPSVTSELSEFLSGPDGEPKKKRLAKKKIAKKGSQKNVVLENSQAVSRAPFSTRLTENLIEKLNLATATRRLKKKSPWTQQAIAEEALQEWLKRNS